MPVPAPAGIWGPRKNPAKRFLWGEEPQGSARSFHRQVETEQSGLCGDEVAGQTVTVKVISIDANNRINLSIKQALPQPPRQERGAPRRANAGGERRPAPGRRSAPVFQGEPVQPKGPASFEDQLKQFMASSDSKLSELHMTEKRGSRRGRR